MKHTDILLGVLRYEDELIPSIVFVSINQNYSHVFCSLLFWMACRALAAICSGVGGVAVVFVGGAAVDKPRGGVA